MRKRQYYEEEAELVGAQNAAAEEDFYDGEDEEKEDFMEEIDDPPNPAPPRRRTGKARAPRQSTTAPAPPSQRGGARRPPTRRRIPKQPSLFSRLSPQKLSQNVTRTGSGIVISLIAIGCLILIFHLFAGSRFFALRGIDVRGNILLSADEIETMVKPNISRGVLNADLEQIHQSLEKYPLIRKAEVARLLPDRLRVIIVERQPVALARRKDGSLVCVDTEGVMFGDNSYWRGKHDQPLISGLAESGDRAAEINRQWVMTYRRLLADLDQIEPPLSSRIDEVHFDEDRGVRLTLKDSRIAVLIGHDDFRTRLNASLDVLDAVRRKDPEALNVLRISDAERLMSGAKIAYLNAMDPKRVIVGLDE
jgi:cell division septal protein FtsQ